MANFSLKNKVCVHYTGSFTSGEVFDTTAGRAPLTYIEGNHEVVPGFEAAVATMQPGEKKKVRVPAKNAYGERDPMLLMTMPTEMIPRSDDLVAGQMIYLMDERGYQRLARVVRVQDDGETVFDFNHPMAGSDIDYEIELVSREPVEDAEGAGDVAEGDGADHA